jgi:hypothetical protein
MFSFSPGQGLVENILVDISWDYGRKLCEKKEKVMLDEKMGKVAKEEKKKKKKREEKKCSIMFIVLKILC